MPTSTSSTASSGIDLTTLWITAASSAAAAYATSKIWAPGTLAAAAFTPVMVAIIREGLAKSTAVVSKAVPVKGVVRSARPDGPQPLETAASSGGWTAADAAGEAPPGVAARADDPALRVAQPGEIAYHDSGRRARRWRAAIVTGLLGFLVAAVVFTVPELVAGGSAAGGGRGTTLFGTPRDGGTPAVTTQTVTTPPTKTVTTAPQRTVTVAPQTVTTPPAATTTVPPPAATTVPTTTVPPAVAEPPAVEVPPG